MIRVWTSPPLPPPTLSDAFLSTPRVCAWSPKPLLHEAFFSATSGYSQNEKEGVALEAAKNMKILD